MKRVLKTSVILTNKCAIFLSMLQEQKTVMNAGFSFYYETQTPVISSIPLATLLVVVWIFGVFCQLDRSLMKGWRKKSWHPERVSSLFTFVSACVSVCTWAIEHTFWHRNLIFVCLCALGHEKETHYFFSKCYFFTLFIGIFQFFPLHNTSKAHVTVFHLAM